MDREFHSVWLRTALLLAMIALTGGVIGWWVDATAGLAGALLLAVIALLRHIHQLARLARWLSVPDQPVPHATGVWEDVFSLLYRARRQAQQEREQVQMELARFRSLGNALPDGVVILDATGHIEWCNPTAERFFDIEARRDAGRPLLNLVRAPELSSFLGADPLNEPLVIRIARGEGLVLSMRVIPYGHEKRLLLARDVTQAERIEGMRRDFVANVSHELKTPLTVVHGFVETLQDDDLPLTAERRIRVLGLMRQQTDRMLQLIEDLLTLSALESAPGPAVRTPLDLGVLLPVVHAEALALSGGRHQLHCECPAGQVLLGEERELRSAFGNLLSNAIRYTPEGGSITLRWQVRAGGQGELSVTDTGIGIEGRHLPRLTERFYRVDRSRSRETGGTGLGLAIVKHVLNRHEAVLEVSSEPGHGSCFMAVFPASRLAPAALQGGTPRSLPAGDQRPQLAPSAQKVTRS